MLDVTKRRIVKTRKEHECFGCAKTINKGDDAICITAKEDERHARLHIHLECNKIIAKKKIDLRRGCVKNDAALSGRSKIEQWECRYCDNVFPPINNDGDKVCSSCGAEWQSAKTIAKE